MTTPRSTPCAMCRRPASGYAYIGKDRYCHGDEEPNPTCYERAQMPFEEWLP